MSVGNVHRNVENGVCIQYMFHTSAAAIFFSIVSLDGALEFGVAGRKLRSKATPPVVIFAFSPKSRKDTKSSN